MNLVTGNDLKTGAVTWWTGDGWSVHIEDAADAGDEAEAIATVSNPSEGRAIATVSNPRGS